jgi:DNA-directed RNA polymerase subunit RPC12/RpoP
MIDKCPECGSKDIVMEREPRLDRKSTFLHSLFGIVKNAVQPARHRKGRFVFLCKSCGKSGLFFVD